MVGVQQRSTKVVGIGPCHVRRGAEGVLFVQHREQKAESISLLLSAPLGVKVAGRTEPDSSQRCKAKG